MNTGAMESRVTSPHNGALSLGACQPRIPPQLWRAQTNRLDGAPRPGLRVARMKGFKVLSESGDQTCSPGPLSFLERRSAAYLCGFDAGRRGRDIGACQYEGHNDASLALQRLWMAGHFDAVTGAMRPRRLRPAHITHRKAVRVRWPKSSYARHRLQLIISHSLI